MSFQVLDQLYTNDVSVFVGLPGVLWVLPDSYIDVKNKDYGGSLFLQPSFCISI